MRLAVLLLLALPASAVAQPAAAPTPPVHPSATAHPSATPSVLKVTAPLPPPVAIRPPHADKATSPPAKPASAKPSSAKPPAPKPGDRKLAGKPGDHKPTAKPARKPAPPPAAVPAPAPAPDPAEAPAAERGKGSNSGQPLPRFAALRSDDVNFRSGPGTRYPIEWVYKRRDLPVQIEREFDLWRLVRDPMGNKGWVNQATLTGRRTAIVAGAERVLRQAASDTAGPVAKLQVGVILRLRSCEAGSEWCQAQIADYRGFIKRSEVWGVMADEVIQ